jgi:hypothetical protein
MDKYLIDKRFARDVPGVELTYIGGRSAEGASMYLIFGLIARTRSVVFINMIHAKEHGQMLDDANMSAFTEIADHFFRQIELGRL